MEELTSVIRRKRMQNGLTVEETAQKANISMEAYHAIEDANYIYFREDYGQVKPTLATIFNALDINKEDYREEISALLNEVDNVKELERIAEHLKNPFEHDELFPERSPSSKRSMWISIAIAVVCYVLYLVIVNFK